MGFNPLIDEVPIEWDGCPVNTDFRQPLRFFRCVADKSLTNEEKAEFTIRLFFDLRKLPKKSEELWGFIQFFVSGGNTEENEPGKKLFDFEVDAGKILAAFWQTYGIDLSVEKMHWWVFLELFRALPDNTMFAKAIDIRGREVPKGGDPKAWYALLRAKRALSLEPDDPHNLADWFKGL